MKILLVSNQGYDNSGIGNPIMFRMKNALSKDPRISESEFLPIKNSIGCFLRVRNIAKQYDIVHIHFGGLYALLIWFILIGIKTKKLITFHGTDIHAKAIKTAKSRKERIKIRINQISSFISIFLFTKSGFVSSDLINYVPKFIKKRFASRLFTQSLGVDYDLFRSIDKKEAQEHLGLPYGKYVLFSDVSHSPIKRRDIAETIINHLGNTFKMLLMCGVPSNEVPYYINACDFGILTSDEEGSPNIIRECLALNRPFFSVDVGDASTQLQGLENSAIISRSPIQAAKQIGMVIRKEYVDNTRISLREKLDFVEVSKAVVDLYSKL